MYLSIVSFKVFPKHYYLLQFFFLFDHLYKIIFIISSLILFLILISILFPVTYFNFTLNYFIVKNIGLHVN